MVVALHSSNKILYCLCSGHADKSYSCVAKVPREGFTIKLRLQMPQPT